MKSITKQCLLAVNSNGVITFNKINYITTSMIYELKLNKFISIENRLVNIKNDLTEEFSYLKEMHLLISNNNNSNIDKIRREIWKNKKTFIDELKKIKEILINEQLINKDDNKTTEVEIDYFKNYLINKIESVEMFDEYDSYFISLLRDSNAINNFISLEQQDKLRKKIMNDNKPSFLVLSTLDAKKHYIPFIIAYIIFFIILFWYVDNILYIVLAAFAYGISEGLLMAKLNKKNIW